MVNSNQMYGNANSMDMSVNAGLRNFMMSVYTKLCLGIGLAGILAYVVGTNMVPGSFDLVFNSPFSHVVRWGPIALILVSGFLIRKPTPFLSGALYWTIVVLLGLSLSMWVALAGMDGSVATRNGGSMSTSFMTIAKAFVVTSGAFAGLTLYGYTTKRDLGPIGTFLNIALWGFIIIGVISIFTGLPSLFETLLMGGVLLVSAGLVATDTQQLKESYFHYQGDEAALAALSNHGALNFFILFYNMFTILLSFMSQD